MTSSYVIGIAFGDARNDVIRSRYKIEESRTDTMLTKGLVQRIPIHP